MSGHLTSNLNVMPCVLGGVAVGASLAFLALTQSALKKFDVSGSQTPWQKAAPAPTVGDPNSSGLFDDTQGYVKPPDTPTGFTMRDAGFNTFLEKWEPGSYEPPHSHPGDDATVVIEGIMEIKFFKKLAGDLVQDGPVLRLVAGQTGFIKSNRIHDARYITKCKLIYVHNTVFGFKDERAVKK
ncbi:hypothetical protein TrVE_jg1277 [Triparma verrucosa]|uniref:Uncharacterized protein n=1 Tax=Triparma verrucosa TaxID=1606542 RepID=A0A9W7BV79_9STRA|nr:hypothetical protein TrVE_jg1277 [Triparma verrucosa]